jgi:hypothetical protein
VSGRSGRECVYNERIPGSIAGPSTSQPASDPYSGGLDLAGLVVDPALLSGAGPQRADIDAFVLSRARRIFTSLEEWHSTATSYFATVSKRLPIVSNRRFMSRLAPASATVPADFTVLCLCMRLLLQHPPAQAQSMQSSLYLTLKSLISLLEATDYSSMELCQSRLLVVFYEIGHGLAAASVSIAACARTARAFGLHKEWSNLGLNQQPSLEQEERRRVCWAIFNLDRYALALPRIQFD